MGDSSVRRLAISFDRENETYLPGELVSGKILAEFTKPKKVRGVKVVVSGKAVVKWSQKSERPDKDGHYHDETFSGQEDYFSSKFFLLGSDSGPTIELPAGQLCYPFNIQLPMNLPGSFEHDYGYVRYTIKAIFDRPWKFDHEVKTAFTVISTYDLNQKSQASLSIHEEIEKDFCCFCVCSGSMSATVSIPWSGFVPGQIIPVAIQYENQSSVEVEKVKVSLRKKLKFYASSPSWSTKEDEVIVFEEKRMNPFSNNSEDPVTINLKVPSLPPSSLEYCGIIDLDYLLRVVFCFSGMHCSVERRFPILIGTVPLYNTMNAFNPMAVTAPAPSAPSLQGPVTTGMSFPGVPLPGAPGLSQPPLGFVVTNPPYPTYGDPNNLPPPSYEESVYGARSIRDKNESEYVHGAGVPFAPRYPVYNYNPPDYVVPNAPMSEKQ